MKERIVLFLTASDCSKKSIVKKWGLDACVNHNFEASTISPLKEIFSQVIIYDFVRNYVELGVGKANSDIVNIVRHKRPDYLLWPSMNYEIKETTFDEIRHLGTKVIGWFFDDEVRFEEYSRNWIPHLDYCLTNDVESLSKYISLGARAKYFIVYSNPNVFQRLKLPNRYDVSFIGTKIGDREQAIKSLSDAGVIVKTFGRGWDSDYIPIEQMIEIYNVTRINLSFMKSYGVNTRPQLKCKIFDICMCGGFLLCEYIPGLEKYYNIDKEIVCFRNLTDAQQKIEYYLRNEDERKKIAKAGYERAIRDYSCRERWHELFQTFQNEHCVSGSQPPKVRIPIAINIRKYGFHLQWAKALLFEGYNISRWREEMVLALSYHWLNLTAWCYLLAGLVFPLRGAKFQKFMETLENACRINLKIIKRAFRQPVNE